MGIGAVGFTTRFRVFTPAQLEATYKKLADLGYQAVETCLGKAAGLSLEDDLKLVQKYNLKILTADGDIDKPDEYKKRAEKIGVNILRVGGIPGEMLNSVDGFKAFAERLNKWAKNYSGYKILYHNHVQEFRNFPELNGKCGQQILIEETDKETIGFEIDTFWTAAGGADPAQWIRMVKNRIPIVHFKDYAVDYKCLEAKVGHHAPRFAEVGHGNINWPEVVKACREAGVQWYCVEQDRTIIDEFESLKISINYMKGLGIN